MDKLHSFRTGDIVTLTCEDVPMSVAKAGNPYSEDSQITCVWLDKNLAPRLFTYPFQCLQYFIEE